MNWVDVRKLLLKMLFFVMLFVAFDHFAGSILGKGLDHYYGLAEPAGILCVGDSHTVLGIDKVRIERETGVKVAKFALEGANTLDRQALLDYYLRKCPNSVRVVIYDVSDKTFSSKGLSSNSYRLLFPFMDDPGVRKYVRENCHDWTEYWLRRFLCTPRFDESAISVAMRGYLGNWSNLKYGTVDIVRLEKDITEGRYRQILFDDANIKVFEDSVETVRNHGIPIVLLYIPTVDVINRTEPEKHRIAVEKFLTLSKKDRGVIFLDYNSEYEEQHKLFYDPIHMNPEGQKVITGRLIGDLRRILDTSNLSLSSKAVRERINDRDSSD